MMTLTRIVLAGLVFASVDAAAGPTTIAALDPQQPASTTSETPAVPPVHRRPLTLTVMTGSDLPAHTYRYNAGIGVAIGAPLGRFHVRGVFALHQGKTAAITWGPVSALGIPGGVQEYDSTPIFGVVDGGYPISLAVGHTKTTFMPYLSTGFALIPMASSGAYGDSTTVNSYFVIGGGASYSVPVTPTMSLGLQYRIYNLGDTSFHYGDLSEGTVEHGFTTSVFYNAVYAELSFRIR